MAIQTICELNLVATGPKLNLNDLNMPRHAPESEYPQSVDDLMFSAVDDVSQTEP
jgi:hypothetical protein